jgi:CheY-like chemotaxis protein
MVTQSASSSTTASRKELERIGVQYALVHRDVHHLLLMDGDDNIREVLGEFISAMGYAILEARDGLEALQICDEAAEKGLRIDGAILDLTVENGMSGRDAIGILRKKFPHMPVFASSRNIEDPVMVWPTGYGFTDSIAKPFRKHELIAMLRESLQIAS